MSDEKPPKVGYSSPQHFLARVDPIWLFMAVVAVLVLVNIFLLLKSGMSELLVGFLGGFWLCVLVGFAVYLWRKKEARK